MANDAIELVSSRYGAHNLRVDPELTARKGLRQDKLPNSNHGFRGTRPGPLPR